MTAAKRVRKAIAGIATAALLATAPCIAGCTQIAEDIATIQKVISGAESKPTGELPPKKQLTGDYILDEYGLFNSKTEEKLEEQAAELAGTYGIAPYLLVTDSPGDQPVRKFAEEYWLENGLGIGDEGDGILFVIAVDSRDYVTLTHSKGIYVFSDYAIQKLEGSVRLCLIGDDWKDAAEDYLECCREMMEHEALYGEPLESSIDQNKVKVKVTPW